MTSDEDHQIMKSIVCLALTMRSFPILKMYVEYRMSFYLSIVSRDGPTHRPRVPRLHYISRRLDILEGQDSENADASYGPLVRMETNSERIARTSCLIICPGRVRKAKQRWLPRGYYGGWECGTLPTQMIFALCGIALFNWSHASTLLQTLQKFLHTIGSYHLAIAPTAKYTNRHKAWL